MAVYNEADFVMQGREVQDPEIAKDELELYYDVKGKKNGDIHKNKLLDMSGQGKDGELSGFDYDGELSGYDGDNGLVFDGIEDTLELGEVEGVEKVSATRNLFDGRAFKYNEQSGDVVWADGQLTYKRTDGGSLSGALYSYDLVQGRTYTFSSELVEGALPDVFVLDDKMSTIIGIELEGSFTARSNRVYISFSSWNGADDGRTLKNIQLEEGSTATPYVPYIPTAKMTYQLNNNAISYGEGGKVKWVKDGKVMERKGINTATNSTFYTGNHSGFIRNTGDVSISGGVATFRQDKAGSNSHAGFYRRPSTFNLEEGDIALISIEVKPEHNVGLRLGLGSRIKYFSDLKENQWNRREVVLENINSQHTIFYYDMSSKYEMGDTVEFRNIQVVNLTATFGAGNEPTIEEIQADPDKWQWLPNPMDLLEARELKGNILGDMEDIVDASPRDRQSGKEVFTEHADDSHVEVEVDGQSYQHAGSGKNLHQPKMIIDDEQRVSGTGNNLANAGGDEYWYIDYLDGIKGNAQYTFSIKTDTEYEGGGFYHVLDKDYELVLGSGGSAQGVENGHTFTTPPNSKYIRYSFPYGVESAVQLEEGSVVTEYEPPALTPDYPIGIESVNDFDVVSSVGGRNLLPNSKEVKLAHNNDGGGIDSSTFTNGVGKLTLGARRNLSTYSHFDRSNLVNGETYTFSIDVMSEVDRYIYLDWRRSNFAQQIIANKWYRISYSRVYDENDRVYVLGLASNTRVESETSIYYKNPKVEKGDVATPWTPAPEDITPDTDHPLIDKVNLNLDEPLRSVGDVKDRVYKDSDGLWKVERIVREITLDSAWKNGGDYDNTSVFGTQLPGKKAGISVLRTNRFKTLDYPTQFGGIDEEGISGNASDAYPEHIYIRINRERLIDTESSWLDNWLSTNPLVIQYQLNTPTIEALDQELQDQLNTLKSFKGSNYVYTVQNTDNPHKESLIPTLHATFNSKDYLKETRTLTNLLIWARELTDGELIHHNQLFLNRFNLQSDTVSGEPIEQTLNLLHGGIVGHSLEQNYTINI